MWGECHGVVTCLQCLSVVNFTDQSNYIIAGHMSERKSGNTKEKILLSAMELFWHNSVASVGVERICQQAGVQKGSFYHFFESKDTLVSELIDWMGEQAQERFLRPAFLSDAPPTRRFADYMQLLAAQWVENDFGQGNGEHWPGCPMGNMAIELSTQSEDLRQKLCELMDTHRRYYQHAFMQAQLEEEITKEITPADLALLYAALWQGSILMAKTYNDPQIVGQVTRQFLQLVKC